MDSKINRVFLALLFGGISMFNLTQAQNINRIVTEKLISGIGLSEMINNSYSISADRRRIAFRIQSGRKQIIVVDTMKGKPYDMVGNPVLSPNSQRIAYSALKDTNWLLNIDNREEVILDSGSVIKLIMFSPDSKSYGYLVKSGTKFYFVNNGVKGKLLDSIDENSITFSSDGRRNAFTATLGNKQFVVIDGVESELFDQVGYPVFSTDGKRTAYWAMNAKQYFSIIDNQKSGPYTFVGSIIFSENGQHCAYNVTVGDKQSVYWDNVQSENYDLVHSLSFSPDGSRLAYGVELAEGSKEGLKDYLVVDGKKNGPYQSVSEGSLKFSPDGSDLAYKMEMSDQFIMVNNRNQKMVYSDILYSTAVFSPNSEHLAYAAENNSNRLVNADGNEIGPYEDVYSIAYSPDSKRLAYSIKSESKESVIVDGKDGRAYDSLLGQGEIVFDSPDMFHYIAAKGNNIYLVEEKIK